MTNIFRWQQIPTHCRSLTTYLIDTLVLIHPKSLLRDKSNMIENWSDLQSRDMRCGTRNDYSTESPTIWDLTSEGTQKGELNRRRWKTTVSLVRILWRHSTDSTDQLGRFNYPWDRIDRKDWSSGKGDESMYNLTKTVSRPFWFSSLSTSFSYSGPRRGRWDPTLRKQLRKL